jgi:uncharacterized OsmC-like protein
VTLEAISRAMQRFRAVLGRRPEAGIHADEPAIACWAQGTRVVSRHANGVQVATDMPGELGGTGDQVTPGWLFRAALASCAATRIALGAAAEEIVLTRLEVSAGSTSDARGLFGMVNGAGERVRAAPSEVRLEVRVCAPHIPPERLQSLIEDSCRCSPVSDAVLNAVPVSLRIEIDSG